MEFDLNCELDYDALEGNESYYLLLLLSKFDEIIEQSCFLIETRILLDYLFELRSVNGFQIYFTIYICQSFV